jgi:hypothetical protein
MVGGRGWSNRVRLMEISRMVGLLVVDGGGYIAWWWPALLGGRERTWGREKGGRKWKFGERNRLLPLWFFFWSWLTRLEIVAFGCNQLPQFWNLRISNCLKSEGIWILLVECLCIELSTLSSIVDTQVIFHQISNAKSHVSPSNHSSAR